LTYRRFEDLPVWNAAIDLAIRVYTLGESGSLGRYSGLKNQIERAALSVSNNIAEGFERGTTAEMVAFLYIARGSAGEVRSMLALLERVDSEQNADLVKLRIQVLDISRQLGSWIGSLQNSNVQGVKTLTGKQKAEQSATKRREDFLGQLRHLQSGARSFENRSEEQNNDHDRID